MRSAREAVTHALLVRKASVWLFRKYPVVVTELVTGIETADAIGFDHRGGSTLVECKASRSDFLADRKKVFRLLPAMGMGSTRYYLCPPGVIREAELPQGWGLLYLNDQSLRLVKLGTPLAKNVPAEYSVLLSLIRRACKPDQGVSISVYIMPTKNTATAVVEALPPENPAQGERL